jgi:hypothetical protein
MLDYTLVSPKATYRLLTPADVPFFLRMVQAARVEAGDTHLFDPARILATVKELQPARGKGSVYVFEREQKLAGYCVLVNCWSTEQCGTAIVADEFWVVPEMREQDLAADFLLLLSKVAPEGSTSIRIELPRGRKSSAPYVKLGFRESGRDVLFMRVRRERAAGGRLRR